jgi:hypothetical protein
MSDRFNILYLEYPGWCVLSKPYDVTFVDTFTSQLGTQIIKLDFDNSFDWITGSSFNYVGSQFRIFTPDFFGVIFNARYMCVGQNSLATEFYFVLIDGNPIVPTTSSTIRLEDSYKLCTSIPDWVTGEDAKKRWMPIISELSPTLSQQIKPEGGIAPINGFSIICVNDNRYDGYEKDGRFYPRLENILQQDSFVNIPTFTNSEDQEVEFIINNLEGLVVSEDEVVLNRSDIFTSYTGDLIEDEYIDCPWINLEAINFISQSSGTSTIERGINGTLALTHPSQSVVFNRMPSIFGANCTLYSTSNQNFESQFSIIYKGIIENIVFDNNLTLFGLELSSVLFTGRISTLFDKSATTIIRTKRNLGLGRTSQFERDVYSGLPENQPNIFSKTNFYGRFYTLQSNPEQSYSWVKIGNLALTIKKVFVPFVDPAIQFDAELSPEYIKILELYQFKTDIDSIRQYFNDQTLSGKFYVFYLAIPYITTIDLDNAIISPYMPRSDRFKVSNILRLDFIQDDIVSPIEKPLDAIIYTTPAVYRNNARSTSFVFTDDTDQLFENYLRDQEIVICHVFDKTRSGAANAVLANAYGEDLPPDLTDFDLIQFNPIENQRARYNRVHIADIILQLLTSTGNGNNGPFDVLPSDFGLGINYNIIDIDSFTKFCERNRDYTLSNAYIDTTEGDIGSYLENKLLTANFLALAQGFNGTVRLVDLTDLQIDPGNPAINYVSNLINSDGVNGFEIELEYNSEYLANNIKAIFRQPWYNTEGVGALRSVVIDIRQGSGLGTTTGAIQNIYQRLRQEPIIKEYDYAPVGNISIYFDGGTQQQQETIFRSVVNSRSSKFINLYKKPVPILTFTLDTDIAIPLQIGDLGRFIGIPLINTEGQTVTPSGSVVYKVIEAVYDYIQRICVYKAILIPDRFFISEPRWHLTAKIESIISDAGNYIVTLEPQYGVSDESTSYGTEIDNWLLDSSQFFVGDTLTVLNSNYTEKVDFVVTSKSDNILITTDNLSTVVAGDIIIAKDVNSISSNYAPSLLGINFNTIR